MAKKSKKSDAFCDACGVLYKLPDSKFCIRCKGKK